MYLAPVTAAAELPVTRAEAKAHLRVDGTDEDSLIDALIAAATSHLEGRNGVLGRALVTQTWDYRVDGFPGAGSGWIELPLPPLQSVTSVKYLDETNTEQTLDAARYVVETGHVHGYVRPAYGLTWPGTLDEANAVRIRFVAGFGAATAVPQPLKHAILLLVGHWFVNREAVGAAGAPMPIAVDALCQPFRIYP